MDLETLQSQMKVVIQKHQIVVTEMRKDPQNSVLQKQLSDLNLEIKSLSEKQKQIMQQLRNNLQKKPQATATVATPVSIQPLFQNSVQTQELMVCSAPKPLMNHRLSTPLHTVTLTPKQMPNFVSNALHQPTSVGNLVTSTTGTLTLKGPMGTVVLPNCSTATALIANKSSETKLQPVLVVPTPTNRVMDGPQTGVVLNIVPPIRVPQYPPSTRTTTTLHPQRAPVFSSSFNNIASGTITHVPSPKIASPITDNKLFCSSLLPCTASTSSPPTASTAAAAAVPSCSSKMNHHFEKPVAIKIDPEKREFMAALGLVAKETLFDMKNKKVERKRRSTANPQFSNAALEEKWKNAAAAAQAMGAQLKRPRGRPRLESRIPSTAINGIGPSTSSSNTQESPRNGSSSLKSSAAAAGSSFSSVSSSVATASSSLSSSVTPSVVSSVPNGIHRRISPAEEKKVEKLLSNLCIVCTQPGDLVKCDSCAKQQHLGCMQPPLPVKPEAPWQCSECQLRADPLVVVQSYDALKAAKEDEKKKLLKKSLDLRLKRSQLERRVEQLKTHSASQKEKKSELQLSLKKTENSIELLQRVVVCIRQYS